MAFTLFVFLMTNIFEGMTNFATLKPLGSIYDVKIYPYLLLQALALWRVFLQALSIGENLAVEHAESYRHSALGIQRCKVYQYHNDLLIPTSPIGQ